MINIKIQVTFNGKKPNRKTKKIFGSTRSFLTKKISPALVFSTVILSLVLALGVNLVFAWTDPSANPPSGNVDVPINTGSTAQTKTGSFTANGWSLQNNYFYDDNELVIRATDEWLRLNQNSNFSNGIYTPLKMRSDGGFNVDGNTVIDSNAGWHRTYGNTGWYNGTYGGGWYMIDSTWVRVYNNKDVYTAGRIRADTSLCIGTDCRSSWPSGGGSDTLQSVTNRGNTTTKNIYSPRYYDKDNSTYYADPAGRSKLNGVTSYSNISCNNCAITADNNIQAHGRIISDETIRGYDDLVISGSGSFGGSVFADNDIKAGSDIVADNSIYVHNDLRVDDKIYAPNHGWEDVRDSYPHTAYCGCDNGWYVAGVNFGGDGDCNHIKCASPFKQYNPPNPPGGWNPPCFTAKTEILMADGTSKSIAEVQTGEYILTRESEISSKLVKAKVLEVYEHETNAYLLVNGYLEVTPDHRMFVNGDWKAVQELETGDKLLDKDNNEVIVESIMAIEERPDIKVYNLEIETYKTYFADGFYVHNIKENPPL